MALQTTQVELTFTQGADNKTDSKNTAYTSFQTLKNSRYSKIGAVIPRGGLTNFATFSGLTGSTDVIADNDYIVAKNDESTYLISLETISNRIGSEMPGAYKRVYSGDTSANISTIGAFTLGTANLVVHIWAAQDNITTGNVGIAVYDAVSGRVMAKGTTRNLGRVYAMQYYNNNGPRLMYEDSTHTLRIVSIDPFAASTALILGSNATYANAPTATTTLRWAVASNNTAVMVTYAEDGSTTVKKQFFTSSSTAPVGSAALTFTNPARSLANTVVTTQAGANFMMCATSDATGGTAEVQAAFYTSAGAPVGSTQTTSATVQAAPLKCWAYETSTTPMYGFSWLIGGTAPVVREYAFTTSSIIPLGPYSAQALPVSAPTVNRLMLLDAFTEPTYGSQAILKMSDAATNVSPVAVVGVGMNLGQSNNAEQMQLNRPGVIGTKTYFNCPVVTAVDGFAPPTGTIGKVGLTLKTQASILIWDSAELVTSFLDRSNQQALYIGTSSRVVGATERLGTPWPELTTQIADLSVVVGTRVANPSVVSYVFAKVWKSSEGVEYRTYSTIYTANFVAAQTLQYILRTQEFYTHTTALLVSSIELYRTQENGTIFYLAQTQTLPGTYTDTSTEAGILGNRTADLNAGELPPQAVPAMRAITNFADRVAFVSADKPSTVGFNRPSFYPVGTSTANGLEVDISTEGGDIVTMQDMDSCLYIFKANTISTLYGDPAGATGEGSTLATPKILFNGTGCTDARSAILTSKGIVFKSGKGFYLIARNQQLSFVGEGPISDTSKVTGATVAQNQYEVIFSHASGSTWVLNLDTGAWYEWVHPSVIRGVSSSSGSIYMITDTALLKYNEAVSKDLTSIDYAQDIKTGWVRTSNIRGFQRVRRAYMEGSCTLACNLKVQVFVDYGSTPVQEFNFNIVPQDVLQLDLHLAVQKCESMSFRFLTDKAGLSLSGGTLEVGLKQGPDKSRSSSSNY